MKITIQETGGGSLARAEKILAGIPGGVQKAAQSAMTRTVTNLRTKVGERVRERYAISNANLRLGDNMKVRYTMGQGVSAIILFNGSKIPLYRYEGASPKSPAYLNERVPALVNGNWRMVRPGVNAHGHQLTGTGSIAFPHAFVARMASGHTGIFERDGDGISEIMGSSLPQMVGNEEVIEKLSEDASKKFEERMDHEISRILNGWGK